MTTKRVALHTLGCKVNQYEADAFLNIFLQNGYEAVDFADQADVYLIHTCTVTHLGDRKSRQLIRRAVKNNPDALIVVSGCYAQVAPEEVAKIPGVDLIVGTQDRGKILELLEEAKRKKEPINAVRDIMHTHDFEELSRQHTGKERAFLKIEEGCQQFCSYCIIPFARGPVRSREPQRTIQEVQQLVSQGYKEIVLTGIHTGAYGQDLGSPYNLNWLIIELSKTPGLKRLRLSSLDPNEFTEDFIETLAANPIICPHLHISLQSGDDDVLRRMNRRYTTTAFAKLVFKLRQKIADLALTTDIMVGFPGETAKQHENSLHFVEEMGFAALHVFKYSPRQGTKAAQFPDRISPEIKEKRSQEMLCLGEKLAVQFKQKYLGRKMEILVETKHKRLWEGHTTNYLKLKFPSDEELRGELVQVSLEQICSDYILGKLV
ncbi:tRNA (N(6)-L-threonylcarbamoyladenosine(37)-C(2))-methylthiotransferase MtaB [Bacillota bacterium LX-D]|nr:tRNA (N(6)-L-threonylcarbamoyladenosine(37)-C(2))-methylthiotransferase MtaB [Bacillota bacterium LX-D]